jgi:hypothetical protein
MALTVVPGTGVISKVTMARVDVTAAPNNAANGSEIRYRIRARLAPYPDLLSYQFATNASGTHSWYAPTFPGPGTWVLTLRDAADAQIQTANVTVT